MKEKKENKKDLIIKIILIIIIILLLVHNCVLITKKKYGTPSGNVNIIEITCEDDSKCDITDKKDSIKEVGSDGSVSLDGDSGNTVNRGNGNESSGSRNNRAGGGNSNSTSNNSSETTGSDSTEETDAEVIVRDKRLMWSDSSDLKIFTNSVYNLEDKIAPEVSNTYQFVVKNSTSYKVKYNISFSEINPYNINMKYKFKKNNTYIVDHYVSFNELNITDQLLNAKKNDTFYLEWKWVSSDNDTEAGKNQANYSLKIDVEAESI